MNRLLTLLTCLLLGFSGLHAQSEDDLPECFIDYPVKRIKVNDTVRAQVDSMWDALKRGHRVRLVVLDDKENKLKDGDRMILSQKRCSTLVEYLNTKQISVVSYAVAIDRFDKKKKNAVSEMSNAGYKSFTNHEGVYTIILYKEGFEPIPFTGTDSLALAYKDCQEFSVAIASKSEITGREGTIIRIPAGALVNMDGSKPACPNAKICLREYYTKSDMIAAGLTTHSYNRMLVSGGMIYIEATCEGKQLRLVSGKVMEILFPTNGAKKEKGMHTFYGKHSDNLTNWLPSVREEGKTQTPATPKPPIVEDPEGGIEGDYEGGEDEEEYSKLDYYFMESSRLGWINCDHFYEVKDKVDLYVKSDTALKPAVRLVFKDINSVMPGYIYSADRTIKFDDIPKGQVATIVVYAQKGDKYYYAEEEIKVGEERTYELPLAGPMDKTAFEKGLRGLD